MDMMNRDQLFAWAYPTCFNCINSEHQIWNCVWGVRGSPDEEVAVCGQGHFNRVEYQEMCCPPWWKYDAVEPMDTSHCDCYMFENFKKEVYK